MKKLLIIAVIAMLGVSNVKAQENVVKFNPLALIVGAVEVGYERVVNDNQSLQVDLGYTSFSSGVLDYTGLAAGLQYRFYLQEAYDAPVGWFAGPFASYSSSKADSTSGSDFKTSVFSAGGVVGYQWNWEPITLDIYGGPAYYSINADDPTFDFGFDGFGARLGVSLGFAF